jgi:hypothetical protein
MVTSRGIDGVRCLGISRSITVVCTGETLRCWGHTR